jgi:hypothetical protein
MYVCISILISPFSVTPIRSMQRLTAQEKATRERELQVWDGRVAIGSSKANMAIVDACDTYNYIVIGC